MNTEYFGTVGSVVLTYAGVTITWRAAMQTFNGLSQRWEQVLDVTTSVISGAILGSIDLPYKLIARFSRKSVQLVSNPPVYGPGRFEHACDVLGLKAGFTKEDFDRHFIRTAKAVHPDALGSSWLSNKTWEAADLIAQTKGWRI